MSDDMSIPVSRIAGVMVDALRDSLLRETLNRGLTASQAAAGSQLLPTPAATASAGTGTVFQRASALSHSRSAGTSTSQGESSRSLARALPSSSQASSTKKRYVAPSIFASKRHRRSECAQPKSVKYLRDIFCLPSDLRNEDGTVQIPRGTRRNALALCGLFGKIEFRSDMSAEEMRCEVCQVFAGPFGLSAEDIQQKRLFPFLYLQRTGAGSRTLCVPAISGSFECNGRQVATLAKSGGFIYILADSDILGWSSSKPVCIYMHV